MLAAFGGTSGNQTHSSCDKTIITHDQTSFGHLDTCLHCKIDGVQGELQTDCQLPCARTNMALEGEIAPGPIIEFQARMINTHLFPENTGGQTTDTHQKSHPEGGIRPYRPYVRPLLLGVDCDYNQVSNFISPSPFNFMSARPMSCASGFLLRNYAPGYLYAMSPTFEVPPGRGCAAGFSDVMSLTSDRPENHYDDGRPFGL